MRRILTSYFQSYSPFSVSSDLGDFPPLVLPVFDERTSIGVQTEVSHDPGPSVSTSGPTKSPDAVVALLPEVEVERDERIQDASVELESEAEVIVLELDPVSDEEQEEAPVVPEETPPERAANPSPTVTLPETPEVLDKDPASPADEPHKLESSSDTTLEVPPIQRDEELWFEDGNLILIAGNVEFRVYKGPLIVQSGVFKDMLSLPQPQDGIAACAGPGPSCAVVHLTESAQDVRHFLRTFFEGTLRYEPTFDEISAYIRLAHKYQCEKLMERSLNYLKKYYVDDFEQWFKVTSLDPPSFQAHHRIGVVNLARLTSASGILPVALMCCCMLGSEISDGFTREDGTKEMLSLEDLTRCFVGRAKLLEATFVAAHKTFRSTVAEGCKDPPRCKDALQRLLHEIIENTSLMKDIRELRFDNSKSDYILATDDNRDLCSKCYAMIGKHGRQADQHREIFRELPAMMGVTVEKWKWNNDVEDNEDNTTV